MALHLTHHDDRKEKWQSHTVSILNNNTLFSCSVENIEGYGSNKEEALEEFVKKFDAAMEVLKEFENYIHGEHVEIFDVDYRGELI